MNDYELYARERTVLCHYGHVNVLLLLVHEHVDDYEYVNVHEHEHIHHGYAHGCVYAYVRGYAAMR